MTEAGAKIRELAARYPFLAPRDARRMIQLYGTRAFAILGDAAAAGLAKSSGSGGGKGKSRPDMVFNNCTFGPGLTESMLRDWFGRILEEMAASGPEPEPAT